MRGSIPWCFHPSRHPKVPPPWWFLSVRVPEFPSCFNKPSICPARPETPSSTFFCWSVILCPRCTHNFLSDGAMLEQTHTHTPKKSTHFHVEVPLRIGTNICLFWGIFSTTVVILRNSGVLKRSSISMNSYMKIPDIPRLSITPRVDSDWIILTPFWPPQGPGNVAFKNLQVRIQPFDRELHLLDDILTKKNPLNSLSWGKMQKLTEELGWYISCRIFDNRKGCPYAGDLEGCFFYQFYICYTYIMYVYKQMHSLKLTVCPWKYAGRCAYRHLPIFDTPNFGEISIAPWRKK